MEKRIFKEKLINQEGVIISDKGRSPGGIFAATALNGARFFWFFFAYFVYLAHFTKFTRGSSLLMEKLFSRRKSKSRRKVLVIKKKETKGKQVQRRKKENHSGQDKKNSFVKATSIGGASRWRPDFGQRSRLKL